MTNTAPYVVTIRLDDFAQFQGLIEAIADLIAASEGDHPDQCQAVRDAIDAYREGLS